MMAVEMVVYDASAEKKDVSGLTALVRGCCTYS